MPSACGDPSMPVANKIKLQVCQLTQRKQIRVASAAWAAHEMNALAALLERPITDAELAGALAPARRHGLAGGGR